MKRWTGIGNTLVNKYIPASGMVIGDEERANLLKVVEGRDWCRGHYTHEFERKLADMMGVKYAHFCNSGSSANLLAITALTSPLLGKRRICKGDKVITSALAFPTTVNPILQNGLKPVFVDVEIPTYVPADHTPPSCKAAIIADTLGNHAPRMDTRWFIRDLCDALGNDMSDCDMATFSFYPAHHITTGEGGAVLTNDPLLSKIIVSLRDWGRECWCEPAQDNACGHRFDGDYDHKYTYSHIGYNLKGNEFAAAIGVAQLDKYVEFAEKRIWNWAKMRAYFKHHIPKNIILPEYRTGNGVPFGFPLILRKPYDRKQFCMALEKAGIGTRLFFGGNLLRQPAYAELKQGVDYYIAGTLENTNLIHEQGFWIGCWPGITDEMVDYMVEVIHREVKCLQP